MTKVAMIGVGKLGQACAEVMAETYPLVGYDVSPREPKNFPMVDTTKEAVEYADIIFIAAPTPHDPAYDGRYPTAHLPNKDFDYTIVKNILAEVNKWSNRSQLVVLISTVLPGTVRRELEPLITNARFVYNPYLIAMGTVAWDFVNPEMIMIGSKNGLAGKNCSIRSAQLESFYNTVCDNDPRMEFGTYEEVESMKIFYNTFISTKVALVNMIQDVAQKTGNMNVDKVTEALAKSTKRIISPKYMKAGMGDGGACHPRDNIALRWLAKELDLGYDMFESIMTAREKQAENMALEILKHGKSVFFTSDSYKPGVNMPDGSSSLLLQYYVKKHGGQIVNGFDTPVQVLVRVHESDNISADDSTIIFDPWRSYPKADNVIYYGDTCTTQ